MRVTIKTQCYPLAARTARIRDPLNEVAVALLRHGDVGHYEIHQALESLSRFWERLASGDAELTDFVDDFDGSKRRAIKRSTKWKL